MLKMVDGTGIIGVDMICPLGVSAPQPPNYDRVELEGTGMLVLPNSLDAPLERLELGGKTEQFSAKGLNLFNYKDFVDISTYADEGAGYRRKYLQLKPNTSYRMTIFKNRMSPSMDATVMFIGNKEKYDNTAANGKIVLFTITDKKSATIVTGESGQIVFKLNKNSTPELQEEYLSKADIILSEGSTEIPYEPYTGGKPSPSPEYPQEIKSVGKWNEEKQKYEVSVKVTGKNLFDREKAKDVSNWISIEGDGYLKFPIRAKKGSMITFSYTEKLTEGKKFYLGITKKETGSVIAWLYHDTNLSVSNSKYTIAAEEDYVYLMCIRSSIRSFLDTIQTLQVEISPAQTDYQPYAEQTLTLTSDRPLTKWDKLVEQDGQIGWLYQSSKMILDGTKIKWLHSNKPENSYFATTIIDAYGGKGASFCKTYRNIQDPAYDIKYANERCIYSDHPTYTSGDKFFRAPNENVTTLEQWKEFIDENPIEMLYHTKNSEFVPLPQSEQNAIRALKTYYPTTVITADGGELDPDIKVTYRKEI